MTGGDAELAAMATVSEALTPLDDASRNRVLRWAADRFELAPPPSEARIAPTRGMDDIPGSRRWADMHEMFASTEASSDAERALLVGYWLQKYEEQTSFTGHQINSTLKHMGVGSSNISAVFGRLIGRRPALVQQISKSGRAQQARKQYRLTSAGIAAAEEILARGATV